MLNESGDIGLNRVDSTGTGHRLGAEVGGNAVPAWLARAQFEVLARVTGMYVSQSVFASLLGEIGTQRRAG